MATATEILAHSEITTRPPQNGTAEFHRRIGSISRQSSVYFAGTILSTAAGYFFKIYLARRLGAEKLGLYALGITLVGFVGLFNTVGLPTAAARFVAAYSAQKDFQRLGRFLRATAGVLTAGNVLLALAFVVVGRWLVVRLYHAPTLVPFLWAFALIMLFGVLNTFLGQVMAGYQDVTRRTVITHFVGSPCNIGLGILLISAGFGFTGYLWAQVGSACVVLVLLLISVWKLTPIPARLSVSARLDREVIGFSAAAFGIAALEFVLAQADKIVLGCYLSAKEVGIYAVAMSLVGFVPIALQSVNQIFSPTIAELHVSGNRDLLQGLYSTLTKWIVILTLPLALTVVIFSRPLLGIFGSTFQAGATVLAIGAFGQLLNCAVGSVGYLLLMSGNQRELVRIQAVSAAMMIALNVILVSRLGIAGAAIATAITVAITNLWSLRTVHRKLKIFPYQGGYLKLVFPTGLAIVSLMMLNRGMLSLHCYWSASLTALICSYVVFLGAFLMFGLEDQDRALGQLAWTRVREFLERRP